MPYRKRDADERAPDEGRDGVVGDLVRQFADPYAFFRELVQNAIDAGSPSIRVELARDADGALLISVRDAGEGMDRDVLESKLLVLFRSGKEGMAGKIGKFGIGFVSVLAIQPSVVKVQSARGGTGHTLHLYADHSYELFEHGATAPGTTVTLVVPIPTGKADALIEQHVQRSRVSLRRWCEHARVPIELRVDESAFGDNKVERIDREFLLDGVLCPLRARSVDRRTTVLAGLSGQPGHKASFYNQGLLLTETDESLGFPGLVLKVQDGALEHTLSRDNVRRDQRFAQVMAFAHGVVQDALRKRVHDAMRAAASEADAYRELASAVAHTALDPVGLPLRLLHAHDEGGAAAEARHFVATERRRTTFRGARSATPMSELLAKRGERMIDLGALPEPYVRRLDTGGVRIDTSWSEKLSAVEVLQHKPGSSDARLLAAVTQALDDAYRDPEGVHFGVIRGAAAGELCIGLPDTEGRPTDPFRLLPFRRTPLILNATHPLVLSARRTAATSLALATDLVSRAVLRSHAALSPSRSEGLLARALTGVLAEAPPERGEG